MDVTLGDFAKAPKKWVTAAREGEEIIITDGGLPIVRMAGVRSADLLARLHRDGLITPPAAQRAVPRLPQAEAAKDALSSLMGRLRR